MVRIYPSLMGADPLNLENEIALLEPYCAGFHLDVMDNHFVPNITWGANTINAIAQRGKPVWVHLMLEEPDLFYSTLSLPADSIVSFHIESKVDILGLIKIIREKKHKPSLAISPKTALVEIFPFLDVVDQVLVMSVNPGFSGQAFLKGSLDRLIELVSYRENYKSSFRIGVDGGIDITNIKMVNEIGVDDCAIASAIFKQGDSVLALPQLQSVAV